MKEMMNKRAKSAIKDDSSEVESIGNFGMLSDCRKEDDSQSDQPINDDFQIDLINKLFQENEGKLLDVERAPPQQISKKKFSLNQDQEIDKALTSSLHQAKKSSKKRKLKDFNEPIDAIHPPTFRQ